MAVVAAMSPLGGCAAVESHLHDTRHPRPAYPAIAATYVCIAPCLPLSLAESAIDGRGLGMCDGNAFLALGAMTGLLVGHAVGGAMYVVGSPLEFALPLSAEDVALPIAAGRSDPDGAPRDRDAPRGPTDRGDPR